MTLFGTTLGAEQIAGLVGLMALLVFWVVALRNEQGALFHFRKWEADRKARREAEIAKDTGGATSAPSPAKSDAAKRGPWG
jgi:hypothetical protein